MESEKSDHLQTSKTISITWLEINCQKLLGTPEIAGSILTVLAKKNVTDIEIQSKLFEILGEKGFDLIQIIYDNRHHLVREFLNRKLQVIIFVHYAQFLSRSYQLHQQTKGHKLLKLLELLVPNKLN